VLFLSPTSKFQVMKLPKKVGRTEFLETLGGLYGFCRRERMVGSCFCNDFFKTYALIPCLFFNRKGLIMKFIPFYHFT
jgi:hypothetical protein